MLKRDLGEGSYFTKQCALFFFFFYFKYCFLSCVSIKERVNIACHFTINA